MKEDSGIVFLVGAGPGDPGLITVHGLELLRRADVIVHDRLAAVELLREMRSDAEVIDAGKAPGRHSMTQDEINALLVARAKNGRRVVRLKGGDPFVFGRGGEEVQACREAGVRCVVVPGVSSAFAAPAAAGIPVTHRGLARTCMVITGKSGSDDTLDHLDDRALCAADTLVVLMGRATLGMMVERLVRAGRPRETPVACISWATTPKQRVAAATLVDIVEAVERDGLTSPMVTVIGDVVGLRDEAPTGSALSACDLGEDFAGAGARVLNGKRIVLTGTESSMRRLRRLLSARGAHVIEHPMITIRYPEKNDDLDAAIANLNRYAWVVFGSVHAVHGFWRRLHAAGLDARAMASVKLAAVGGATARSLHRRGLVADLVPEVHSAEALAKALIALAPKSGSRVLHPQSDRGRPTIAELLRQAGLQVDRVVAYRTVETTSPPPAAGMEAADAVLLCSPSAARRFAALYPHVRDPVFACIGPVTAAAAREAGLDVRVVAAEHTVGGLVAALEQYAHMGGGS